MPRNADTLRSVRTIDDLIHYLEAELDWPLQGYNTEDLTFTYEPAELGLNDKDAVRIRHIYQLRPLEHNQPWGIFFVEFEQKKLPVVVLRRILSHLVVKKRASANSAERASWHTEDLLFISAFGEEQSAQREIAFAHFHQEAGDLPTLRVLGWDGADTALKLENVAATLKERLHWPDDPTDHVAWRAQWAAPFRHRIGHIIRTADKLAEELAKLARSIRLRAEMKVPGRAWLVFEVRDEGAGRSRMVQTAVFEPRGLFGVLYWYSLYPIHQGIFSGMANAIRRRAEAAPSSVGTGARG